MKKIVCDGCDLDLTDRPHAILDVEVTISSGAAVKQEEVKKHFDLCSDCRDRFKRAFPDKWARPAKEHLVPTEATAYHR